MKEFEFIPEGQEECSVRAWLHASEKSENPKNYPAVIICPGGAYEDISEREADPVAAQFFAAGYHTFILNYSVGAQAQKFRPLLQLAETIAQIRRYSKEWFVSPEKIAVCGFSAGGHLACSLGVLFNEPEFLKFFQKKENIRPDAMILGYPVITADEFAHVPSIENVSGAKEGSELYQWFGLEKHVDCDTPPTFLWHTAEDEAVPVENSLKMAIALSQAGVSYELHILPKGRHGLSICTEEVDTPCEYNGRWLDWCMKWLRCVWTEK